MTILMLLSCLLVEPRVPNDYEVSAEAESGASEVSL